MSLRFFVDQCVPASVGKVLRAADHEVFILKDHLAPDAPDAVVIAKAQELAAILVSANGDFADIVLYPPSRYAGIVSLQYHGHPESGPRLVERLMEFTRSNPLASDYVGKLLVFEPHRVRIRH